ncbi:MAG: hypothetical protein ACK476_05590 [Fluviicola sp.]|jgi:hypothetical protein
MIKLTTVSIVILTLFSCSNNESKQNNHVDNINKVDTVDVNIFKPKQGSKEFQYHFCDKNGNKIKPEFYFEDTLILKMFYTKKIDKKYTDFKLGVKARSNINSVKQLSKNKFQLILKKENDLTAFCFEPYISSKKIVFEGAYHDTLTVLSKNEFSHSFSWACYSYLVK